MPLLMELWSNMDLESIRAAFGLLVDCRLGFSSDPSVLYAGRFLFSSPFSRYTGRDDDDECANETCQWIDRKRTMMRIADASGGEE